MGRMEEEDRIVLRRNHSATWEFVLLPVVGLIAWLLVRQGGVVFVACGLGLLALTFIFCYPAVSLRLRYGKEVVFAELTPIGLGFVGGPTLHWTGFTEFKRIAWEATPGYLGFVMTPEQLAKSPNSKKCLEMREQWRRRYGVDYVLPLATADVCAEELAEYIARFVPESPAFVHKPDPAKP